MPITESDNLTRYFFLGFIRLHLLYHASQEPVFGLDMIRELAHHGYTTSPGTLYPILHDLEDKGFLKSETHVVGGKTRKYYRATRRGKSAVKRATKQALELLHEINVQDS
jgi:DNA-binding PadR family transcriptional regulator